MSDISEIERDVEQARDNLNRTLDAIHHKAAATSELLLPEQEIRRYPVSSLCGGAGPWFGGGRRAHPGAADWRDGDWFADCRGKW
jgi:Protein of unknown function (DUF3618)